MSDWQKLIDRLEAARDDPIGISADRLYGDVERTVYGVTESDLLLLLELLSPHCVSQPPIIEQTSCGSIG